MLISTPRHVTVTTAKTAVPTMSERCRRRFREDKQSGTNQSPNTDGHHTPWAKSEQGEIDQPCKRKNCPVAFFKQGPDRAPG